MSQKYLSITFLLLTTFYLNAQNKWELGITLGTGLSGWHTQFDNGWLSPGEKKGFRLAPAFTGGLQATYPIAKNLQLRSGLMYQNSASRYTRKVNTVAPASVQDRPRSVTRNTYRLHQLEIPLQVQWKLGQKLKAPFLNLGITTNYILGGQRNIYRFTSRNDNKERDSLPLNFALAENQSIRFFVQPTIGIGWQLSERWSWATNFSDKGR